MLYTVIGLWSTDNQIWGLKIEAANADEAARKAVEEMLRETDRAREDAAEFQVIDAIEGDVKSGLGNDYPTTGSTISRPNFRRRPRRAP